MAAARIIASRMARTIARAVSWAGAWAVVMDGSGVEVGALERSPPPKAMPRAGHCTPRFQRPSGAAMKPVPQWENRGSCGPPIMGSRTMQQAIFITGAGGGIGAATARLFAAKGWQVGGCDLRMEAIESLADAIGRERFKPYVADVRDRASLAPAISDFAARHGGRLDAVFANAGVLFMAPDDQIDPEQKDLQVDVNVKGVMRDVTRASPPAIPGGARRACRAAQPRRDGTRRTPRTHRVRAAVRATAVPA